MSSNATKKRRRNALLQRLYDEAKGICFYCKEQIPLGFATKDHQIPVARGGIKGSTNCVLSCHTCNSMKSYFTAEEWEFVLKEFPEIEQLRKSLFAKMIQRHEAGNEQEG